VSDLAGKIPLLGSLLGPLLQKIGLGVNAVNRLNHGRCVSCKGLKIKCVGSVLYLEPEGSGVFLGPQR